MSPQVRLFVVVGALFAVAATPTVTGQSQTTAAVGSDQLSIPPRVLPMSAKEILSLLPATPDGWKTVSSVAANQVSSWVLTIAQRQIESAAASPPQGNRGAAAPAMMRTTFMLIDTGFDPSAAGAFVGFKPGVVGNAEKMIVRQQPTIRTKASATSESAQMLINGRFVLRIRVENQPTDAVLSWIQQVPLDRYNVAASSRLLKLPPQVRVSSVDELNPANNHESTVTIGDHTSQPGP